jgi:YbgC/YbaW family acyl-CoA thioester hydrolase
MYKGKIHRFNTKVSYRDLDMYSVAYHPKYFEFADTARNQAFADFGYPVQDQLKDKVGFTVAGMENVSFKRPLFMGEEIDVFTEASDFTNKTCKVTHWINVGNDDSEIIEESKFSKAVFKATYTLVFVSIDEIGEFPLNAENIKRLKVVEFSEKVRRSLGL